MPLPSNFDVVTVRGSYVNLDGSPAAGSVTFSANIGANTFLKDTGADVMILPVTRSVTLDSQGSFTTTLPATDDPDISPTGYTYTVTEKFATGSRTYSIQVPRNTTVDLATVSPVASVTAAVSLVTQSQVGVAGGVAKLDSDGDVNDASGTKILAGGGGGGSGGSVVSTSITDSTAIGRSVLTAASAAAARTALGAGISNLAIGTTSSTAKAGDYQPTSANISDATVVGKSVLTAADAAAARTALGAAPSASPTFSGTVAGVTKAMVGLGNVDNTSDASKPLSTAATSALALKAATATTVNGHALSGNVVVSASDLTTGTLAVAQAPIAATLMVHCISGVWQPRPTTRTNVSVIYLARAVGDPDPTDYVAGVDIELRPQA